MTIAAQVIDNQWKVKVTSSRSKYVPGLINRLIFAAPEFTLPMLYSQIWTIAAPVPQPSDRNTDCRSKSQPVHPIGQSLIAAPRIVQQWFTAAPNTTNR